MGTVLTHREGFKLADFLVYCHNRKWNAPVMEDGKIVFRFPRVVRRTGAGTLKSNLTVKGKQIYKQLRHTLQVAGFKPQKPRVMYDTVDNYTYVELPTDLFCVIMRNN